MKEGTWDGTREWREMRENGEQEEEEIRYEADADAS